MRVPCLMRWPGVLPAGESRDQLMGTIDILPTALGIAGGTPPQAPEVDGANIIDILRDGDPNPERAIFFYRGRNLQAMRQGAWKLRVTQDGSALYNLADDIGESTNVISEAPDRAETMRSRMREFDEKLKSNARPSGRSQIP